MQDIKFMVIKYIRLSEADNNVEQESGSANRIADMLNERRVITFNYEFKYKNVLALIDSSGGTVNGS